MNYNFYSALNSFKDFHDAIIKDSKDQFLPVVKNTAQGPNGIELVPPKDQRWIDGAEKVVNFVSEEFGKILAALKKPPSDLHPYSLSRYQETSHFLDRFVSTLQNKVAHETLSWSSWGERVIKRICCTPLETPAMKMGMIKQQQRQIQAELDQILNQKLQTELTDCEKLWTKHSEELKKVSLEASQKIQLTKEAFLQSSGSIDDLEKAIKEIRIALNGIQEKIRKIKDDLNLTLEDLKIWEQCSARPTFQKKICVEALEKIKMELRTLDQSALSFLEEGFAFCDYYFFEVHPDPEGSSRRTESREAAKLRGAVNAGRKEAQRLHQLSSSTRSQDILQMLHAYLKLKERQVEMNAKKKILGPEFENSLSAKKEKEKTLLSDIASEYEKMMQQKHSWHTRLLPWNWFRPYIDADKYQQALAAKVKKEKEMHSLQEDNSKLEKEAASNKKVLAELEKPIEEINTVLSTFEQRTDVKQWIESKLPSKIGYKTHWLMTHFKPQKIDELSAARRLFEEFYLLTLESVHKSITGGALILTTNENDLKKRLEEKAEQFKQFKVPALARQVEEKYPSNTSFDLDEANKKEAEQASSLFGKIISLISAFNNMKS